MFADAIMPSCGLGPHLFHTDIRASHRHGELRAQSVLVGLDLAYRQRRASTKRFLVSRTGPFVNDPKDKQHQQASAKKPNAAQHQRFEQTLIRSEMNDQLRAAETQLGIRNLLVNEAASKLTMNGKWI